jgi:hypothetical protein
LGGDITTKLGQRHRLAVFDLPQPLLDRPQGLIVREDLCRLFKSVVFVDRYQDCCRPPAPSHDDVFPQVGNAIDEVSEFTAQFADRHGFSHGVVYRIEYTGARGGDGDRTHQRLACHAPRVGVDQTCPKRLLNYFRGSGTICFVSSASEFAFSDLIRQPTRIASVVEKRGRVVLRRRNAPDLVLSQAGNLSGLAGFARLLAGMLRHTPSAEVTEALIDGLPWTRYLTDAGRGDFVAGLPAVVADCEDLDTFAPLEIYLSEWRATAAIQADPELTDRLSKPIKKPTRIPVTKP